MYLQQAMRGRAPKCPNDFSYWNLFAFFAGNVPKTERPKRSAKRILGSTHYTQTVRPSKMLTVELWRSKKKEDSKSKKVYSEWTRLENTWSSWWLNQPFWKICSSNWIIFPKDRGENNKYLSCHHLVMIAGVHWTVSSGISSPQLR